MKKIVSVPHHVFEELVELIREEHKTQAEETEKAEGKIVKKEDAARAAAENAAWATAWGIADAARDAAGDAARDAGDAEWAAAENAAWATAWEKELLRILEIKGEGKKKYE